LHPQLCIFYQNSLGKFLDFLGPRADQPMTEVAKKDIVAFRNTLAGNVSPKTANHNLRAVKSFYQKRSSG
jgi:site-specific recombinase XerD